MPEDRIDRKYDQALRHYYERVADAIGQADDVLVMGPGEAPGELVKTLERGPGPVARVVGVEAADKMTERQVVARVRQFFGQELPRRTGNE